MSPITINSIVTTHRHHLLRQIGKIHSPSPILHSEIQIDSTSYAASTKAHSYNMRLASTKKDVRAAQRLRFLVFNLELREGQDHSHDDARHDEDEYDDICDHLLVESGGMVVGTYRLHTNSYNKPDRGYYSEQEFDFSPFESMRNEITELGRACVAPDHRNGVVLTLLWRGIIAYAYTHHCRYLIGCTSLASQYLANAVSAYTLLAKEFFAPLPWRTKPKRMCLCPQHSRSSDSVPRLPKLLFTYLSLGARICAPPAIDRKFNTVDFLTYLDLSSVQFRATRFFKSTSCI